MHVDKSNNLSSIGADSKVFIKTFKRMRYFLVCFLKLVIYFYVLPRNKQIKVSLLV